MTLRELLVFQSIYLAKTQSDILDLIYCQPKPTIFYKSYLEFDAANLVSVFAFDSNSTGHLLSDKFSEFFGAKYPLFYKNKYSRGTSGASFYRNAVENALRMNQAKSVEKIIDFIVKY